MFKPLLLAAGVLASVAGCATKVENPVDYVTFRNEPLVKQVDKGMSKQQVREIGGPPSTEMQRTNVEGTCNNYVLNRDGHQQPYHVSFNASGVVDGKGFMTCEEMERHERAART
ncbi:transcriptional regulator [Pseudomonas sp. PIC25]|jgi:osmotically inducible lipoprotein OsmE|uniref:osmotically-inducible lipoprotein OsmE n=1 Tax=Pseudomonas sp. PIC25 TaxID=1958773 RepID=UPI000BABA18B|nr:osmotically-inducible lipoprotein OsmE [Pseudomonas sp. PIC25]PAU62490.1 transcriptional regulator [Pseudomonas sp. PIC25]